MKRLTIALLAFGLAFGSTFPAAAETPAETGARLRAQLAEHEGMNSDQLERAARYRRSERNLAPCTGRASVGKCRINLQRNPGESISQARRREARRLGE